MPSKEDLQRHIKVGLEREGLLTGEFPYIEEEMLTHLTDHLWGVVGMWLKYPNHTLLRQVSTDAFKTVIAYFYQEDRYEAHATEVTFLEGIRDRLQEDEDWVV